MRAGLELAIGAPPPANEAERKRREEFLDELCNFELAKEEAAQWQREEDERDERIEELPLRVTPNDEDRAWVHERYVGELLKGELRDDTRAQFTSLVDRLRDAENIDAVILGGTELTLLLPTAVIADVPALDTTALHVDAMVKRLRQTGANL